MKIHLLLTQQLMKKIFLFALCALFTTALFAQNDPQTPKKKQTSIVGRSNDHFLLQLGYLSWSGMPDTINTGGLPRSVNFYFMLDYPFKTNPHLSMAFGAGLASDHIGFKKTAVGIKENVDAMRFTNVSDTNHFKNTNLVTSWLEAPIEFRYSANPEGNGFKFAIGVKVGLLMGAHTRNKDLQDKNGNSINPYTMKEYSKKFFNTSRASIMGRVGMGHISLFGNYQVSALFKDGRGPKINPISVGITLSGL